MSKVITTLLPGDAVERLFFNAHATREHVQGRPSLEQIWRHLCNVDVGPPQYRDKDRTELYQELLTEWQGLSIDDSQKWTQGLEQRLGSANNVNDFFEWRRSRIRSERPDYNRLAPHDFAELLRRAEWTQADLAAQIVTGRLWYGHTHEKVEKVDYFLGCFKSSGEIDILGLRLNAHIFELKETELDLCGDLGISNLLPHMFVGIRYRPDHSQFSPVESVTTCVIILGKFGVCSGCYIIHSSCTGLICSGELFLIPARAATIGGPLFPSKQLKSTGHLLAYDLSDSRLYVLLNPSTSAQIKADVQVAELVATAGESLLEYGFWSHDLPEAKKGQDIPDVEWRVLSFTEREFAEVGRQASHGAYVAMFPPERSV